MAAVDHERILLRLKEHVLSKRSHGQDELLAQLARLEVECELPESEEGFDARPARAASASDRSSLDPAAAGREIEMTSR